MNRFGINFDIFFPGRLNQSQREELALIEQAYDNPHECNAPFRIAPFLED
jgi:hypothetical protein